MTPTQLAWLAGVIGVGTFIRAAIRAAIPAIQAYVDSTVTKKDDEWLAKWLPRFDALIGVLDLIRRVVPGTVIGPLFVNQPKATIIGRPTLPSIKPLSMPPPMPLGAYTKRPVPPPIGGDDKP